MRGIDAIVILSLGLHQLHGSFSLHEVLPSYLTLLS